MSGGEFATVVTASSEAACGYPFVVGNTYEVHARITGDYPVTDACSGTRISSRTIPVIGYPTDPVPNRTMPLVWSGLLIAIGLGLVALATARIRTRRHH